MAECGSYLCRKRVLVVPKSQTVALEKGKPRLREQSGVSEAGFCRTLTSSPNDKGPRVKTTQGCRQGGFGGVCERSSEGHRLFAAHSLAPVVWKGGRAKCPASFFTYTAKIRQAAESAGCFILGQPRRPAMAGGGFPGARCCKFAPAASRNFHFPGWLAFL